MSVVETPIGSRGLSVETETFGKQISIVKLISIVKSMSAKAVHCQMSVVKTGIASFALPVRVKSTPLANTCSNWMLASLSGVERGVGERREGTEMQGCNQVLGLSGTT